MSDIVAGSGEAIIHEGRLTLSPVAQRLQLVGHEMLNGGGLTRVEENVFSTCPEPVKRFTERLLRARDKGIPLVEVNLVGSEVGYERINRAFGINGRTINKVLRASGVEQTNHVDAVTNLEYEAVGLSMFSSDSMLQHSEEDMRIDTFAEVGKFEGYDGGRTDLWGRAKGPSSGAHYYQEDGTIFDLPDPSRMHTVLNQALIDLPQALYAETAVTVTAEEISDLPQLSRGVAGYLEG